MLTVVTVSDLLFYLRSGYNIVTGINVTRLKTPHSCTLTLGLLFGSDKTPLQTSPLS